MTPSTLTDAFVGCVGPVPPRHQPGGAALSDALGHFHNPFPKPPWHAASVLVDGIPILSIFHQKSDADLSPAGTNPHHIKP